MRVLPDCLHLVNFSNASSSKWIPRLLNAMMQTAGTAVAIQPGVVTRWTLTWLCACSLRRAQKAFKLLLATIPDNVEQVLASNNKMLSSLRRCFRTIEDKEFRRQLDQYLGLLVPSIERPLSGLSTRLVLQGGNCTRADVAYTKIRHFEKLVAAGKLRDIQALESHWSQLEQPLILLAYFSFQTTSSSVPN